MGKSYYGNWEEEVTEKEALYYLGFHFWEPTHWNYYKVADKNRKVVEKLQALKNAAEAAEGGFSGVKLNSDAILRCYYLRV